MAFNASILHLNPGFRCTWLSSNMHIDYLPDIIVQDDDFLVIPGIFGPRMADISALPQISDRTNLVIFNQNCRYTFLGQSFAYVLARDFSMPYSDPDRYIATMVVSEDSAEYIHAVFPQQKVFRIHNAINVGTLTYQKEGECLASITLSGLATIMMAG